MVEATRVALMLRRPATGREFWSVSAGGREWRAEPRWPSAEALAHVRWQVEDARHTAARFEHRQKVAELAAQLGCELWDSLLYRAPAAVKASLDGTPCRIDTDTTDPAHVAALSLVTASRSGDDWLVVGAGDRGYTAVRPHPLRVLLIVSRPFKDNDAPYLNTALAAAEAGAQHGFALTRLYPPTRSELTRVMRAAEAAGEPFTVVVFDGHGLMDDAGKPHLVFEGMGSAWIDVDTFLGCLGALPPLIVLAACRTAFNPDATPSAATFAGELAARSGVDVVAMNYNITPAQSAIVVRSVLDAVGDGLPPAAGVALARRRIAQREPDTLAWSAPVIFSRTEQRFAPTAARTVAPPPGYPRDFECLVLDRTFGRHAVWLLLGTPHSGKSHFLNFYRWWVGLRGMVPGVACDARDFASPGLLAESLGDLPEGSRLVTIDNAECWAQLPAEAWWPLLDFAASRRSSGLRWLVASRKVLLLPRHTGCPVAGSPLGGLATAGMRRNEEGSARALEDWFGRHPDEDPWLIPLVVAMRGEPIPMRWAAEECRAGRSARDCLWRFVFADARVMQRLVALGVDPGELDGVDPMLGWTSGLQTTFLHVAVRFPLSAWDSDEARQAERDVVALMARLGAAGLALPAGDWWMMSAAHALLLRNGRPVDTWQPHERERYAAYMQGFAAMADSRTDIDFLDKKEPDVEQGESTIDPTDFGISHEQTMLMFLLLSLPKAVIGAQLALETRQPTVLGRVASAMVEPMIDCGLAAASHAWLGHWIEEMSCLAQSGVDCSEGMLLLGRLRESLNFQSGKLPLTELSRKYFLEATAQARARDPEGTAEDQMRAAVAAQRDGGRPSDIERTIALALFSDVFGLRGTGALDAMQEASELAPTMRSKCHLAIAYLRAGRMAEAERACSEAMALADPRSNEEQFFVHAALAELLLATNPEEAGRVVTQCLRFAKALGDNVAIGIAQYLHASHLALVDNLDAARSACADALTKLAAYAPVHEMASLRLVQILMVQQEFALAEIYRANIERSATEGGRELVALEAAAFEPIFAVFSNRLDDAVVSAHRLHALAVRHDSTHEQGIAAWMLGDVQFERGDYAGACEQVERSLRLLRPASGDYQGMACHLLARAKYRLGERKQACAAQRRCVGYMEASRQSPGQIGEALAELEMYALHAGDRAMAHEAAQRMAAMGDSVTRTQRQVALAAFGWAECGDHATARERARLALSCAPEIPAEWIDELRRLAAS